MKCGFKPSQFDGTEKKVNLTKGIVPGSYSLSKLLPPVLNQGDTYKCVAYSCANALTYYGKVKELPKVDYTNMIDPIYNSRTNNTDDGMSIKDALRFVRLKVKKDFATIGSIEQLKRAIIAYGPCLGALPVCNSSKFFWKDGQVQGGHCILIVGFDSVGFTIMNSWGQNWGIKGFTTIPYKDFDKFYELWTLI